MLGAYNDKGFKKAVKKTLEKEGILSDHPSDRGGFTKYGITRPFLSDYYGNRAATKYDIRALTRDQAIEIYYIQIWDKFRIKEMALYYQEFMFDYIIHAGVKAVLRLQKHVGVAQDGHVGPRTLEAVWSKAGRHEYNELVRGRMESAMRIIERDHTQATFAVGWQRRIHSFYKWGY